MFGLHPSAPTRAEDYAVHRAGRPLRNTRVRPRGLTSRRLAQLASADPREVRHVTPDPWVSEPALVLSDVVAGPEPWTGTLLDPAWLRPVPIGSVVRSAGPTPARHWLVWPDARLRPAKRLAGSGTGESLAQFPIMGRPPGGAPPEPRSRPATGRPFDLLAAVSSVTRPGAARSWRRRFRPRCPEQPEAVDGGSAPQCRDRWFRQHQTARVRRRSICPQRGSRIAWRINAHGKSC